jgi:hypothetical protein
MTPWKAVRVARNKDSGGWIKRNRGEIKWRNLHLR